MSGAACSATSTTGPSSARWRWRSGCGSSRRPSTAIFPGARRGLDSAITELREALEELRELARGIHPVVLTNRGLEPPVAALASLVYAWLSMLSVVGSAADGGPGGGRGDRRRRVVVALVIRRAA